LSIVVMTLDFNPTFPLDCDVWLWLLVAVRDVLEAVITELLKSLD